MATNNNNSNNNNNIQKKQSNLPPGTRQTSLKNVVARLQEVAASLITGRVFGPNLPLQPTTVTTPVIDSRTGQYSDEMTGGPRQYIYPQSANLIPTPRDEYPQLPTFEQIRNLSRLYDVAALCVSTLGMELSGIEHSIIASDHRKQKELADSGELGRVTNFFKRPDGRSDFRSWLIKLVREVLEIDALSIYPRMAMDGSLHSLEIIDGSTIKPVIDDRGIVVGYQQIVKGFPASNYYPFGSLDIKEDEQLDETVFPVGNNQELLYFLYEPQADNPYGRAPVEKVLMRLNMALRKQSFDLNWFTEGNIPEMLMSPPGQTLNVDQVESFEIAFNALMTGNDAARRKAKFLAWDAKPVMLKTFEYNTVLDEYMGKLTMSAFGVTPAELGFTDDVNRASSQGQENVQERRGMRPLAEFVKGLLDYIIQHPRLLNQPEAEWHWHFGSVEDELSKAQEFQVYVNLGVMSPQEVRTMRFGGELEGEAPGIAQIVAMRQMPPAPPPPLDPNAAPPPAAPAPAPTDGTTLGNSAPSTVVASSTDDGGDDDDAPPTNIIDTEAPDDNTDPDDVGTSANNANDTDSSNDENDDSSTATTTTTSKFANIEFAKLGASAAPAPTSTGAPSQPGVGRGHGAHHHGPRAGYTRKTKPVAQPGVGRGHGAHKKSLKAPKAKAKGVGRGHGAHHHGPLKGTAAKVKGKGVGRGHGKHHTGPRGTHAGTPAPKVGTTTAAAAATSSPAQHVGSTAPAPATPPTPAVKFSNLSTTDNRYSLLKAIFSDMQFFDSFDEGDLIMSNAFAKRGGHKKGPGSRGGKFWIDKNGHVRYGPPPSGVKARTPQQWQKHTNTLARKELKGIKTADDLQSLDSSWEVGVAGDLQEGDGPSSYNHFGSGADGKEAAMEAATEAAKQHPDITYAVIKIDGNYVLAGKSTKDLLNDSPDKEGANGSSPSAATTTSAKPDNVA